MEERTVIYYNNIVNGKILPYTYVHGVDGRRYENETAYREALIEEINFLANTNAVISNIEVIKG